MTDEQAIALIAARFYAMDKEVTRNDAIKEAANLMQAAKDEFAQRWIKQQEFQKGKGTR